MSEHCMIFLIFSSFFFDSVFLYANICLSLLGIYNLTFLNSMISQKRFIHEDFEEEDLWIDLSILRFLREEMLLGNLDHISLRDPYKQGLFSSRIDCSWERFRRRALYQV